MKSSQSSYNTIWEAICGDDFAAVFLFRSNLLIAILEEIKGSEMCYNEVIEKCKMSYQEFDDVLCGRIHKLETDRLLQMASNLKLSISFNIVGKE